MTAIAIDPGTLDYDVLNGAPVRDVSGGLLNSIMILILTPLGSYWYDTTIGSKLYLLRRVKDVAGTDVLVRQYAQQALQRLLDSGRATSIDITTQQPFNGWIYLFVTVTAANGQRVTFENPVMVGQ